LISRRQVIAGEGDIHCGPLPGHGVAHRDRLLGKSATATDCDPGTAKHCLGDCVAVDIIKEVSMRRIILAAMLAGFAVSAYAADDTSNKKPAGTAKGAAVGALAGHEMGSGHAVAGAAAGGAIGHHQEKKAEQSKSQ
jgi:hypothetical protein